ATRPAACAPNEDSAVLWVKLARFHIGHCRCVGYYERSGDHGPSVHRASVGAEMKQMQDGDECPDSVAPSMLAGLSALHSGMAEGDTREEIATAARQATMVLETKQLTKRFGVTLAVNAVNFQIAPGEIVALLGENGAGKSTFANIITGLEQADSGDLVFKGRA